MADPVTSVEATELLGIDRATVSEVVGERVIQHREPDDTAYRYEDLLLARLRQHPLIASVPAAGPLLAFARVASEAATHETMIIAAVRLAICLSHSSAAAYYARSATGHYTLRYAEGAGGRFAPSLDADEAIPNVVPGRSTPSGSTLTLPVHAPSAPGDEEQDAPSAASLPLGVLMVERHMDEQGDGSAGAFRAPLVGLCDLLGVAIAHGSCPSIHPSIAAMARLAVTDWGADDRTLDAGLAELAQCLTGTSAALLYRTVPGEQISLAQSAPLLRTATHSSKIQGWPSNALLHGDEIAALLESAAPVTTDIWSRRVPSPQPAGAISMAGMAIGLPDGPVSGLILTFGVARTGIEQDAMPLLVALGRAIARQTRTQGSPPVASPRSDPDDHAPAIADAVSAVFQAPTLSAGLRVLTNTAVTTTRAQASGIHLFHESGTGIRAAGRWSLEHRDIAVDHGPANPWTYYEFTPQAVDSAVQRSRTSQAFQRAVTVLTAGQIVALPLLYHGRVIGVFWIARRADEPSFTHREIADFAALGQHGSPAVERGLLLDRERRQRHEATILLRLASSINSANSLPELMEIVATIAGDAVRADNVSVFVYDSTQTSTVAAAHFSAEIGAGFRLTATRDVHSQAPSVVPAEAEVLRTRRPLVRDAQSPFLITPFDFEWRSDVVVPLLANDAVQGVLYLDEHSREHLFGDEDLALLSAIGQHAGLAVLRVRDAQNSLRRAEYLAALVGLGRALSGTLDAEVLCQKLRDHILAMLPADDVRIVLRGPGSADPAPTGPAVAPDAEPRATLSAAIVRDGITFGEIVIERRDGLAYAAEDAWALDIAAQNAAAALSLARQFAETSAARDSAEGHAQDMRSVLAISHAVASAPDLETMLTVFADEIERLIPHAECVVFRLSPAGDRLEATLFRRNGVPVVLTDPTLPVSSGLCGDVVASGQPTVVNNAHLDCRSIYTPSEQRSIMRRGEHVMVAPLVVGGRSIGVVFLNRSGQDRPFSDAEFTTFRVLAEQAATAVRNATLVDDALDERERSARHSANLEAVLTTARAVTAQIELPRTLGVLADHLQHLLPHDRLTIWRRDRADSAFRPMIARQGGKPDALATALTGTSDDELRRLAQSHTPSRQPLPGGTGHRLLMPLIVPGSPMGVLELVRIGDDGFSDEDATVAQVLAGQAEVAIHASFLFTGERRRHRFAEILVKAAAALNEANTLTEVLRRATEAATDAVRVRCAVLFVYDNTGRRIAVWETVSRATARSLPALPMVAAQDVPVERAMLATRLPIAGDLLSGLLAERPDLNAAGQCGGAAVPLRVGDHVRGVLYVWDDAPEHRGRAFDDDEMALLETICDQAGVAAERALLHADMNRRIAELRAIEGVAAAMTRTMDLRPMLREALDRVADAIHSELSVVALPEGDPPVLRVAESSGRSAGTYVGLELPLDRSVNGRVFATGLPVRGEEGDGTPYLPPDNKSSFVRYFLGVPLQIEGRTIGTLQVLRSAPGPFTAGDEELLRLIASQLAVGIERARNFGVAVAAREQSERQAQHLATVLQSSKTLALQNDLPSTLDAFCDGLERLVPFDHAVVFRIDSDADHLTLLLQRTGGCLELVANHMPLANSLAGDVVRSQAPIRATNAERHARFNPTQWRPGPDFDRATVAGIHAMALPLLVEGTLLGIIAINRVGSSPFTDEELAVAQVFTGQAAAAIRTMDLVSRNRDLYKGVVRSLAAMVDAKDPYTHGHSERVSRLARRIADALGLPSAEAETVELAALLHDIGKIGVPDRILQRPGPLDPADRITMMGHAAQGARIVAQAGIEALQPLVPFIRHHHEWINGNGYPDGITGADIPLGAAIIGVADAFDTLVTDRPYRRGRSTDEAIGELWRCAGTQFRPDIVQVLASLDGMAAAGPRNPGTSLLTLPLPEPPLDASDANSAPIGDVEPGQMGDSRPLAVLVDVARITRHMPDLQTFLDQLPAIVQRRMGYEDVALYLVDQTSGDVRLAAHAGGFRRYADRQRLDGTDAIALEVARTGRAAGTDPVAPGDRQDSELAVPLIVDDTPIGVLSVAASAPSGFAIGDMPALSAIADQLSMAVNVAQLHAAAKHAAATDGLTGVANHRAFYEAMEDVAAIADPFAVILFDVEGLKETNDSRGHLAGDRLLRRVAQTIQANVRETDLVARYGGDEFAVIMYGQDATPERAAAAIRATLLRTNGEPGLGGPTVRYGVAASPIDGTDPYDLVAIADARLYEMRSTYPRGKDRLGPDLLAGD